MVVAKNAKVWGAGRGELTARIALFCASAWRSALATDRLTEMGMENVSHIEGGLSGWKEAGGPVEKREKKG